MAEITFSRAASADLADVYALSAAQFGEDTADSYHGGLQAAVEQLAQFPQSGPVFPGIRPPVRYLAYKRHHIIYDYNGDTVWVIRIIHHARDVRHLM